MDANDFVQKIFPTIKLRQPLFYNWEVGIRFELGVDWKKGYDYPENPYALGCYRRAITLFEAIHSKSDDIFVVIDVNDFDHGRSLNRLLKNFQPYVDKAFLYQLKYQIMPYIYSEDEDEEKDRTHRFSLKCKTSDLKFKPLLKAICNQDLGLRPRIYHDVYFLNINKETIFHVYDDRGCDLLAASPESIRCMYENYNDWILDYDRFEIDKVFK